MLTTDSENDIIKSEETVGITDKCVIANEKIERFCLLPGAKHSEDFFGVGYRPDDRILLINDILDGFDMTKAVDAAVSPENVRKFSIFMYLGVSRKKRFRTVWQQDTPHSISRFITAYRED